MSNSGFVKVSGLSDVNLVVVEPNRQMQLLVRTMLANFGMRRVRVFTDTEKATQAMLIDPPDVVLLDWDAGPLAGAAFLRLFRHKKMYPICMVPVVVMVCEAHQRTVESALRLGAHSVLVKPMSPALLAHRIQWILVGTQKLKLVGERYVVEGMSERLDGKRERRDQLASAREYQASQAAEIVAIQSDVDRILKSSF